MKRYKIAPLLIATVLLVAIGTGGAKLQNCTAEDSTNCYWNAATKGNGEGRSFFDIAGHVLYLP